MVENVETKDYILHIIHQSLEKCSRELQSSLIIKCQPLVLVFSLAESEQKHEELRQHYYE